MSPGQVTVESAPLAIAFDVGSHVAVAFGLLEAAAWLVARLAPGR